MSLSRADLPTSLHEQSSSTQPTLFSPMQSSTDLEKAAAAAAAKLRIGAEVAAAPDAETMMTTSFHPPLSPETAAVKATAELRIDGEVAAAPDAETTPASSCHPALSPGTDPAVSRPSRPGPSVARARARSRALEAAAAATAPAPETTATAPALETTATATAPETTACTSSPQLLSSAPSSSCGAGDLSIPPKATDLFQGKPHRLLHLQESLLHHHQKHQQLREPKLQLLHHARLPKELKVQLLHYLQVQLHHRLVQLLPDQVQLLHFPLPRSLGQEQQQ